MHATLQPALSVGRSVGHVQLFFAAPAHPHATKLAVYPALFYLWVINPSANLLAGKCGKTDDDMDDNINHDNDYTSDNVAQGG